MSQTEYIVSFYPSADKGRYFNSFEAAKDYGEKGLKRWSGCNTIAEHTDGTGCYYLFVRDKVKVCEPLPPPQNERLAAIFETLETTLCDHDGLVSIPGSKKDKANIQNALAALEKEIERGDYYCE